LATELAFWEMRGGWEYINRFPEAVQKVTVEQVQAACRKYFQVKNSTTGLILPEDAGKSSASSTSAASAIGKGKP
jgi:predicted Zn-dependent peptidase